MVALKRGAFKKRGKQSRTEKDWIIKCLKNAFFGCIYCRYLCYNYFLYEALSVTGVAPGGAGA